MKAWHERLCRAFLISLSVATLYLFTEMLKPLEEMSFYALEGGEVVALRSLHNGMLLEVSPNDGRVYATASDGHAYAAQWRVLVLDAATVRALAKSAQEIDRHSYQFTGRAMASGTGCACSGFSNAHGFGRFCHPWESDDQEPWCYVNASCAAATARGSFGKRFESCTPPDPYRSERGGEHFGPDGEDDTAWYNQSAHSAGGAMAGGAMAGGVEPVLMPLGGCNCSGYKNVHGFGAHCQGWEFDGQTPWCYVKPECSQKTRDDSGTPATQGSFGQPFEDCYETWPQQGAREEIPTGRLLAERPDEEAPRAQAQAQAHARAEAEVPVGAELRESGRRPPPRAATRRRLLAPSRLTQMLGGVSLENERLLVLINRQSRGFLQVQPPPHRDALQLTARADALSIRAVFSSFERTHMLLSYATNSLVNLCDEGTSGAACTGDRQGPNEPLKLLRTPRQTARWALEKVPSYYSQPRPAEAGQNNDRSAARAGATFATAGW